MEPGTWEKRNQGRAGNKGREDSGGEGHATACRPTHRHPHPHLHSHSPIDGWSSIREKHDTVKDPCGAWLGLRGLGGVARRVGPRILGWAWRSFGLGLSVLVGGSPLDYDYTVVHVSRQPPVTDERAQQGSRGREAEGCFGLPGVKGLDGWGDSHCLAVGCCAGRPQQSRAQRDRDREGHGLSFNPSVTPPLATVDTLAATSLTGTTTTSSTSFNQQHQFNPTGPDSVSVALPNHETNYANHNRRLTTPEDRGRGWAIVRRRSRCNSLMRRCASAADGHGKSYCSLSVAAPPDHDDDGKRGPSGA
ncbi:hypothetical protein AUP68_15031 [Ilyonectria robusta]